MKKKNCFSNEDIYTQMDEWLFPFLQIIFSPFIILSNNDLFVTEENVERIFHQLVYYYFFTERKKINNLLKIVKSKVTDVKNNCYIIFDFLNKHENMDRISFFSWIFTLKNK